MTRIVGFSQEAEYVAQVDRDNQHHWNTSATFSKQRAYDELGEVWDECKQPNWDCHGASAVDHDTLRNAYIFLEALPLGCPLPSVAAEPDGHISLEWYHAPRWILSVSISPSGTIYYAALFGLSKMRGSEPFYGEVPPIVLRLIQRVTSK